MNLFTDKIKTDLEAQERNRKWIKALRSGEFKQAKEVLYDGRGFCCLGLACHLVKPEWMFRPVEKLIKEEHEGVYYWGENVYDTHLPSPEVQELYCLRIDNGSYGSSSLANDNDIGRTFVQIAAVIERELEEALK